MKVFPSYYGEYQLLTIKQLKIAKNEVIKMDKQIVRIVTRNAPYMLPVKIIIGDYYNIAVNCETYQIENEMIYGFIGVYVVFWMSFLDVEDIIFERCV